MVTVNKLNDSSVHFSSLKHNYIKLVIQNFIGYASTEFMFPLQSFHSLGVEWCSSVSCSSVEIPLIDYACSPGPEVKSQV